VVFYHVGRCLADELGVAAALGAEEELHVVPLLVFKDEAFSLERVYRCPAYRMLPKAWLTARPTWCSRARISATHRPQYRGWRLNKVVGLTLTPTAPKAAMAGFLRSCQYPASI